MSIDNLDSELPHISIYPIPSSGELTFLQEITGSAELSASIINLQGQILYSGIFSKQEFIIDVRELGLEGIYILKLEGEAFTLSRKLIFSE